MTTAQGKFLTHGNFTCLHYTVFTPDKKNCDGTHVSLWIRSTTICRWSHIKRGSSMWHYLMFCSINDSAIQLESALRRCHHHLCNPRMSEHGSLSSKVKCQMLSMYTHGEGPGTPLGARRPCFSAGDGKTPLLRSFHFGAHCLSRVHHGNNITNCLFLLYLTKGGYESTYSIKL